MFQRIHFNNDIVDKLRHNLRHEGLETKSLEWLERVCLKADSAATRRQAAWELALWFADKEAPEDIKLGLRYLRHASRGEKDPIRHRQIAIMAADLYGRIGKVKKAKKILENNIKRDSATFFFLADCHLALANLEESLQQKQAHINKALALHDAAPIEMRKSATTYDSMGFLSAENARRLQVTDDRHLVTVIVPMYNAEHEISTALESLLHQTWTNLEILVVDDASTDKSREVVQKYQERDGRIKLLTSGKNAGVYAARNIALKRATGEFVTCHDSDDWSHPQKIEKQVRNLLENPKLVANVSDMARATSDLRFVRRGNPGFYIQSNISSLMFRHKPVFSKLGYWNRVRSCADTEYFSRIVKMFGVGSTAVVTMALGSVLRRSSSSLTGNPAFGYHGYRMGLRKEYHYAAEHHLKTAKSLRYDFDQKQLPFPVPEPLRSSWPSSSNKKLDRVLMADFYTEDSEDMLKKFILAAERDRASVAIVQRTHFDTWPKEAMTDGVRQLISGHAIRVLVYGEEVRCKELVQFKIDAEGQRYLPNVKADAISSII